MPDRSENEITRFAAALAEKAGVDKVPESALLGSLSGFSKSASGIVRDAFVKGVLDRVLQDRVRDMMKWIIHAQFTPKFDLPLSVDTLSQSNDFGDFNLKAISPDGDRIPLRMFNIDTGSLEEWIFGDVNYCILSHSWKGTEIVFPYLQAIKADLKEKEVYDDMMSHGADEDTRKFAHVQAAKHSHLHVAFSDVQLLRIQCLKDLSDQTRKAFSLLPGSPATTTSHVTHDESGLGAQQVFDFRCKSFTESIGSRRDAILPYLQSLVESKTASTGEWSTTKHSHPAFAVAVEQLMPLIERIRSLQKIEQSLEKTREILDSGLFNPVHKGRRYLWNDTICINKQDANELNHSLAMMGEWYAGAEFCLVQIDTPVNEWIQTFKHLEKPHVQHDATSIAPSDFGHGLYTTFDELYRADPRPRWATRGWTLQELVLPKMAIFANSVWQPLSRAVECLGPYYYLVEYLAEHVRDNEAIVSLPYNLDSLRQVMTANAIGYVEYGIDDLQNLSDDDRVWTETIRRLIGLLDFLGVTFSRNMNEDTAEILIQQGIKSGVAAASSKEVTAAVMKTFGTTDVDQFIRMIVKALAKEAILKVHMDREKMSTLGAVPPSECCRGWRRSQNPGQKMLSLAAYRECTVATDRVYSLMGVLGVQFTVFHAEGMTKALSRMLDEVVTTTNDISVFNWTGRDFGSPNRGRSLYPSTLEAYSPRMLHNVAVAQRKLSVYPTTFKDRKYTLQLTSKNLNILLNDLAKFVRGQDGRRWGSGPIQKLLDVLKGQELESMAQQLPVLSKMLSFFKTEALKNDDATIQSPPPMSPPDTPATPVSPPTSPPPTAAAESGKKSRFGIKTPKIPSMSGVSSSLQSMSPSLPSLQSFGVGKVDSGSAGHQAPPKSKEMSDVESWLEKTKTLEEHNMDDRIQQILNGIAARSLVEPTAQSTIKKGKKNSPAEEAIAPNPISVSTAGIQGFFDVQRVIIDISNPDTLRHKVDTAANTNQKINGNCRISTAIASLDVEFRCTAEQLSKQINICDVVAATVYGDKRSVPIDDLTPEEKEQRVERALDFVEETNLDMIAGEWVLARFSGAPAAKWFLSTFEIGASNSFYGRRIPTNDIDFSSVEPDKVLQSPWEQYMERKKLAMYKVVQNQLSGKDAQQTIDRVSSVVQGRIDRYKQPESSAAGDNEIPDEDRGSTLGSLVGRINIAKGASAAHSLADVFYEREAERLEAALNDEALKGTPKKLRAAVMSLNDNEDLLPAMFVSDVMIHMF